MTAPTLELYNVDISFMAPEEHTVFIAASSEQDAIDKTTLMFQNRSDLKVLKAFVAVQAYKQGDVKGALSPQVDMFNTDDLVSN